jgi:hypothetical protein
MLAVTGLRRFSRPLRHHRKHASAAQRMQQKPPSGGFLFFGPGLFAAGAEFPAGGSR